MFRQVRQSSAHAEFRRRPADYRSPARVQRRGQARAPAEASTPARRFCATGRAHCAFWATCREQFGLLFAQSVRRIVPASRCHLTYLGENPGCASGHMSGAVVDIVCSVRDIYRTSIVARNDGVRWGARLTTVDRLLFGLGRSTAAQMPLVSCLSS